MHATGDVEQEAIRWLDRHQSYERAEDLEGLSEALQSREIAMSVVLKGNDLQPSAIACSKQCLCLSQRQSRVDSVAIET